ncbi:MAG: TIGR02206 family membrane protein [Peptococcaceae bacterium]|nr:TIGR02206 family membrane protein [Peptococcaceae bacterium]
MAECFSFDYPEEPFKLFSMSHNIMLGLILLICLLIVGFRVNLRNVYANKIFRYILISIMMLLEIYVHIWLIIMDQWSITTSLPLHLCDVSIILSVIMLANKSYSIYELTYFWGFGGAVQALLTPDLGPFSFPHCIFFQFFLLHGSIVAACVFMTFVEGYKPTPRSIRKTFVITNVYAVFVAAFNVITGSNYLYVCRKPANPSLLDFLGPWPWYVLSLEFVLLFMCYLYYLPFVIYELGRGRGKGRRIKG